MPEPVRPIDAVFAVEIKVAERRQTGFAPVYTTIECAYGMTPDGALEDARRRINERPLSYASSFGGRWYPPTISLAFALPKAKGK